MAEDLETVQRIPLGDLHAADDNIRREVGDVSELAASIQSVGILEPLTKAAIRSAPSSGRRPATTLTASARAVAVVAQASTVGQQVQVGAADAAEPPDALDAAVDEGVNEPQDNQGDVGVTRDE